MTNYCPHAELHPPRHIAALPVCVKCGTAVLDFDVVYGPLPNGNIRVIGYVDDETGEKVITDPI